ncbi:MAG TPA: hypothetical protein PK059_02160 [Cyclobacteriaceae bacterium]|nr:hypothetical protein [Cyclobacteriaceae bacterium]
MSELPSEIRKKIEENADAYSTDPFQRQDYYMGACDCYRLAQEEIDKLEQTVGSLEGLVKTLEHEIESLRKENEELREEVLRLTIESTMP